MLKSMASVCINNSLCVLGRLSKNDLNYFNMANSNIDFEINLDIKEAKTQLQELKKEARFLAISRFNQGFILGVICSIALCILGYLIIKLF